MYTLLGNVNKFYAVNLKILIDLFDKMILPICTHNCEVWGVSFFNSKSLPSNFLSEKQSKNPIDKLQGSFLKHILGAYSQASNWVVESETNRNSVIPYIVRRSCWWSWMRRHNQFTTIKKIGKTLSTPIDLFINSKVLLNKRLNESIEQSWQFKKTFYK